MANFWDQDDDSNSFTDKPVTVGRRGGTAREAQLAFGKNKQAPGFKTDTGTEEAVIQGARRGITPGVSDYMTAAVNYATAKARGLDYTYDELLKATREQRNEEEIKHPIAAGAGRVGGQMAIAALTGGTSIPAQMATQGTMSAVDTYGTSADTTLGDAAKSGLTSAAISGTIGGTLKGVGKLVGNQLQKIGSKANMDTLWSLVNARTPQSAAELNKLFRIDQMTSPQLRATFGTDGAAIIRQGGKEADDLIQDHASLIARELSMPYGINNMTQAELRSIFGQKGAETVYKGGDDAEQLIQEHAKEIAKMSKKYANVGSAPSANAGFSYMLPGAEESAAKTLSGSLPNVARTALNAGLGGIGLGGAAAAANAMFGSDYNPYLAAAIGATGGAGSRYLGSKYIAMGSPTKDKLAQIPSMVTRTAPAIENPINSQNQGNWWEEDAKSNDDSHIVLENMSHEDLVRLRLNSPDDQELQQRIAPYEHRAFAREVTKDNPLMAVPVGLATPMYQAKKYMERPFITAKPDDTPSSLEQLQQGYMGINDGLNRYLNR